MKGKRGTVTFKVVGDGKLLWQSPVMKPEHDAVAVDVPLSGCKSLVLVSDGTADGKLSLDLQYRDHTVRDIDTNRTEAVFKLADPVYQTEVDLHYIANNAENVIETWSVVRNPGKAPVVVDHAASAFLNISGKTHYLTAFSGSWGCESLMEESLLTPGVREIGSRAGTRTSQIANPAFVLSTGSPAREEEGEVLMGALAWSGNWNMRFGRGLPPRHQPSSHLRRVGTDPWRLTRWLWRVAEMSWSRTDAPRASGFCADPIDVFAGAEDE